MAEKLPAIDTIFEEFLPDYLFKKYKLLDIKSALKNIHFPQNLNFLNQAKYRFNFEKLLIWQLVSNLNFKQRQINKPTQPNREVVKDFLKLLPFELTKAQKRAIKTIIDDMHSGKVMTRLLQ
jgi:ATP-dependent DNA helicase RecG